MKQFQKQLQSKANSVKMTVVERRELKERVQAYMEYHPLPAELATKRTPSAKELLRIDPFAMVHIPFGMIFKTAGVALAVVLLAVPFVAERAVPGDTLYAVKVQFNEELRSTLTFNGADKVEWETERVNRRIAEARLLASEGRLTEEAEAEVAAAVKEHTETAQKEIAELSTVDADEAAIAAIALDTTLEVQASSLKTDATTVEDRTTNLLANVIDESRVQGVGTASSTPPSFDKLMARLEQNTTRVYELRENLAGVASAERLAEVDRRIADIGRTIEEAATAFAEDETKARQQLVDALQRSQKLIVFMTEISVNNTVDIETVVPVVLTPDEKNAKQRALLSELTNKRAQIVNLIAVEEDAGVVEKAEMSLTVIDEALEELTTTEAYLVFVERATDVLMLVDDTIASFASEPIVDEVIDTATTSEDRASTTEPVLPDTDTASSTATSSTDVATADTTKSTTSASHSL